MLERQESSTEAHYCCSDAHLGLARVIEAFQAHARGEANWKQSFAWEEMPL